MSPRTRPARTDSRKGRFYTLPDGTRLPSVTTVLKVVGNKENLIKWAAQTAAEHALRELPALVRRSRTEARDVLVEEVAGRPFAVRDDAAKAGSKAHALAEAHVLGQPYTKPESDSDEDRTLRNFLQWMDDWDPQFEATEAVVANRTYGYAGTLDALVRLPSLNEGALHVLDYKTGRTGPWPDWALQLVAYQHAEELWLPDGTSVPMPPSDGVLVLRLRPDGYALHELVAEHAAIFDAFTSALVLADFTRTADESDPWSPAMPTPQLETTCPS
jgi:hypothetical protein